MTEERSDRLDNIVDAEVSQTYRDTATERAPASLNERVLRQANAHAGSGYSSSIFWLRPLAWAATIGLCLAIVVELSLMPQLEPEVLQQRTLEQKAAAEVEMSVTEDARPYAATPAAAGRLDTGPADTRERRKLQEAEVDRKEDTLPRSIPAPSIGESSSFRDTDAFAVSDAPILEEAEEMARMRQGPNQSAERSQPSADDSSGFSDVDALEVSDAPILEKTEETARMPDGSNQSANRAAPSLASRYEAEGPGLAMEPACDDQAKAEPETWLACIERLRESGLDAEADEQETALRDAFPEFEFP